MLVDKIITPKPIIRSASFEKWSAIDMEWLQGSENCVLFGSDPTTGIVAVEPVGKDTVRIFRKVGSDLVTTDEIFRPFLIIEDKDHLKGFKEPFDLEPLSGPDPLKYLLFFNDWGSLEKAREHLRKITGHTASSPQAPYLYLSDHVNQYLLWSGKTLFKGLTYNQVHRLAIDIETGCAPGFEFSNPARPEDRILSIALMDNRGYAEVLFGREMSETEMLKALGERIQSLNPDVLEGHNIFNFDLHYLVVRARLHNVELNWGRDGSQPIIRNSRFTLAERTIDYNKMEIFGRHVIDTMFLVQHYDVTARELESYGLKAVARHFGLVEEERTYVDQKRVQWYFENDPESLIRYNLDDVKETIGLSELLGYPFFLQAQIFPYSYQNILVRGNATKINSLFLREYLRQRASIPKPKVKGEFAGGYTDLFAEGVVKNIVHCDVTSLYPSILLTFNLEPQQDSLHVFLPLLRDLRSFRIDAKKKAQSSEDLHEREYYQALQQTFKILINSFYGYLGTDIHHFADPDLAAEVTRRGREIIREMLNWLREQRALPVEIDTDGIYFVPPPEVTSEQAVHELVKCLSESLPAGIDVEMDGRYRSMFSYKKKNYALLDYEGNVFIRGSGLRSRGIEKYLREFLSHMIRLLLESRSPQIQRLYGDYLEKLAAHEIDISWLAKTETLSESPETYLQKVKVKKRNRSAAYELALKSGRNFRAGDQISYYVTGKDKKVKVFENCKLVSQFDPACPDENVPYYQAKLDELVKKFKQFWAPETRPCTE